MSNPSSEVVRVTHIVPALFGPGGVVGGDRGAVDARVRGEPAHPGVHGPDRLAEELGLLVEDALPPEEARAERGHRVREVVPAGHAARLTVPVTRATLFRCW